jgi:purine-nucleoside phosphorylase
MGEELIAVSFDDSVNTIKALLPDVLHRPCVGIICGSGLSGLVDSFRDVVIVPYENIPGFATSTGKSEFMKPNLLY